MSVLVRFSPPSMTSDQYDAIVARLYKEGIHPADGLELEVCFGSGDQNEGVYFIRHNGSVPKVW